MRHLNSPAAMLRPHAELCRSAGMRFERVLGLIAVFAAAIAFTASAFCAEIALDTARIEKLTGLKGTANAQEGVFKVSFPRKDIAATVAGVRVIPDMGLSAWAAFTRAGDHTMVMGDIVLLENEVSPVMSAALDMGSRLRPCTITSPGIPRAFSSCISAEWVMRSGWRPLWGRYSEP